MARIRVGVWFDGSYFSKVSDHFRFKSATGQRLDIVGVLDLAKRQVANLAGVADSDVVVTQKDWFRGKFPAAESEAAGKLLAGAKFEDLLRDRGFSLSFHPVQEGSEKEVDVAIAVDVTEAAIRDDVDAVVLFSGDGDFVPAITKARFYGKLVVVIGADERQIDPAPKLAGRLRNVVDRVVDLCGHTADRSLWLAPSPSPSIATTPAPVSHGGSVVAGRLRGICTGKYDTKGGFGFIDDDDGTKGIWFHKASVSPNQFPLLTKGIRVTYGERQVRDKGPVAIDVRVDIGPNSTGGSL